ncbi:MFS transporter [bacterium]|nr:MFS transporter [bacterium]
MNPFAPPPAAVPVPPEEVPGKYEYWRTRQLYATFVGYAIFYFVRKNLSCAMPLMEKQLGIGKAQLGGFLTAHGVIYGLSKFLNGMLADRSNARTFLVFGLLMSALMNFWFGLSSGVLTLGVVWVLNGWFQGMGFPPCARVLSHWFAPQERGVKWGIWNTSHQVGGFVILWLGGWLGQHYGWRAVFYVPALIALVVSFFVYDRLRDTPESLGLPDIEVYAGQPGTDHLEAGQVEPDFARRLRHRVFGNPFVWLICLGNFFVYVVRYVFFDWWPTFLSQERHFELSQAGQLTSYFEVAGLFGSLLAGFLSDRWLKGRRNPVCLFYLFCTLGTILYYRTMPVQGYWQEAAAVAAVGFFIYGPQFLVGVMVTDIAGKEAAASAIGLTGFFGYLSGVLSGYGLGRLVEIYGWDASFQLTIACTLGAILCFALCGRKT